MTPEERDRDRYGDYFAQYLAMKTERDRARKERDYFEQKLLGEKGRRQWAEVRLAKQGGDDSAPSSLVAELMAERELYVEFIRAQGLNFIPFHDPIPHTLHGKPTSERTTKRPPCRPWSDT